jgi:hypothetical protein
MVSIRVVKAGLLAGVVVGGTLAAVPPASASTPFAVVKPYPGAWV